MHAWIGRGKLRLKGEAEEMDSIAYMGYVVVRLCGKEALLFDKGPGVIPLLFSRANRVRHRGVVLAVDKMGICCSSHGDRGVTGLYAEKR